MEATAYLCLDCNCKQAPKLLQSAEDVFKHMGHTPFKKLLEVQNDLLDIEHPVNELISSYNLRDRLKRFDKEVESIIEGFRVRVLGVTDEIKKRIVESFSIRQHIEDVNEIICSSNTTMMQKLSDNLSYYTTGHLGFVIEPIETQEKITNQQIKQINQSMISLFEVSSEAKSKYEVPAKQSIIEQSQEYAEEEEEEIIDRLDHNDDDDFQQGDQTQQRQDRERSKVSLDQSLILLQQQLNAQMNIRQNPPPLSSQARDMRNIGAASVGENYSVEGILADQDDQPILKTMKSNSISQIGMQFSNIVQNFKLTGKEERESLKRQTLKEEELKTQFGDLIQKRSEGFQSEWDNSELMLWDQRFRTVFEQGYEVRFLEQRRLTMKNRESASRFDPLKTMMKILVSFQPLRLEISLTSMRLKDADFITELSGLQSIIELKLDLNNNDIIKIKPFTAIAPLVSLQILHIDLHNNKIRKDKYLAAYKSLTKLTSLNVLLNANNLDNKNLKLTSVGKFQRYFKLDEKA